MTGSMNTLAGQIKRDPFLLISILVGIIIITNLVTNLFPTIISNLVSLGSLGNFTFATLFADDGMVEVVVSAIVLIAVLAIIGVKASGASRR